MSSDQYSGIDTIAFGTKLLQRELIYSPLETIHCNKTMFLLKHQKRLKTPKLA